MMKVAEVELEQAQKHFNADSKGSYDKINAERLLGFRIDLKEVSTIEYYDYLKEADKIARSMQAKK